MDAVEREPQLAALHKCLDEARAGHGCLVAVSGEAGIGKTTLVQGFLRAAHGCRVLQGACDPLTTPRPLGPVLDMAERLGGGLAASLSPDAPREEVFRAVLDELDAAAWVTVAVIEDVHWADEGTLDLLRHVGRRMSASRALLIVTARDDEPGTAALRGVLGDLATAGTVRHVPVPALTPAGVAELVRRAGADADAQHLHDSTAGNPFYVTEVLSAPAGVPETVRAAVLARAERLPPAARQTLDVAAVVPTRVEQWLLAELAGGEVSGIDACVAAGVLRPDAPGTLAFRHELARTAIADAILPGHRTALHGRVLDALLQREDSAADPARVAHHAELAGRSQVACEAARAAAERAVALGSRREAVAQYERALRHAGRLGDAERAGLLEAFFATAVETDRVGADREVEVSTELVALRRRLGEPLALGRALVRHWAALREAMRFEEGAAAEQEALAVLVPKGPSPELAEAHAQRAVMAMLTRRHHDALSEGARAVAVAEQVGDASAMTRALNALGASRILLGDVTAGREDILRCVEVAEAAGLDGTVATAWGNLGSAAGEVRSYSAALDGLTRAREHAEERDLDYMAHYATAWLARVRFEQGDWDGALALVETLPLDSPTTAVITLITALTVQGRILARRGDTGAGAVLERAWGLAAENGDLQRTWPAACGLAEHWLLGGGTGDPPAVLEPLLAQARRLGHVWADGELGWALWRIDGAGRLEGDATPFHLLVQGRPGEAAARWAGLGCPYEEALAREAMGDDDELGASLSILERLGAEADGARVRRLLRERGVAVARGPRPATAQHPAGLTARQAEVLDLVCLGLTDAEIAERLHISRKTAGHHVSALLAKLGASSRTEAAHLASQMG